jgi:hypothetical protein
VVDNSLTIEALPVSRNSSAGTIGRWLKHGLVTSSSALGNLKGEFAEKVEELVVLDMMRKLHTMIQWVDMYYRRDYGR